MIAREGLKGLEVQIKSNAILGRQCPLCKDGVIPLANANPYCSDCEKALGEIVKWWNIVNPVISKFEDRTIINPKKDRE